MDDLEQPKIASSAKLGSVVARVLWSTELSALHPHHGYVSGKAKIELFREDFASPDPVL